MANWILVIWQEVCGDDIRSYIDMLQTFIDGTREGMRDLQTHSRKQELSSIAERSHKMAAPCKHLNALKLHAALRMLSDAANNNNVTDVQSALEQVNREALKAVEEANVEKQRCKDKVRS